MVFASPFFLLGLIVLPFVAFYKHRRQRWEQADFSLSTLAAFASSRQKIGWKTTVRRYLWGLPLLALGLVLVALARPQKSYTDQKIHADGIDIMLSLDISGSMKAQDFTPDRLGAAKDLAISFIDKRAYDRIGLVVFGGESFTQCPLTTDHRILQALVTQVREGLVEDGTAIGMGLATAVTRLKDSGAKSKVVILLTDGVNNAGFIDPRTAAETAREFGVKVYTIGVGTQGEAPYPIQNFFGATAMQYMKVEIDEKLLQEIADRTGGKYFRATDNASLRHIYEEIDQLEKTEIEVTTIKRFTELFPVFLWTALALLLLEYVLRQTWLRSVVG
ncbi:MAG: VWA domain-containing protein [Chitinophagales bacterium]|jgi:Ca-activated chloride channel family protein|nr:VWA domain-containing protein [Chitinophagales bacterium]